MALAFGGRLPVPPQAGGASILVSLVRQVSSVSTGCGFDLKAEASGDCVPWAGEALWGDDLFQGSVWLSFSSPLLHTELTRGVINPLGAKSLFSA